VCQIDQGVLTPEERALAIGVGVLIGDEVNLILDDDVDVDTNVCLAIIVGADVNAVAAVEVVGIDIEPAVGVTVAAFAENEAGECPVDEGDDLDLANLGALDAEVTGDDGVANLDLDLDADTEICIAVINAQGVVIELDENVVVDIDAAVDGVVLIELVNVVNLIDIEVDVVIDKTFLGLDLDVLLPNLPIGANIVLFAEVGGGCPVVAIGTPLPEQLDIDDLVDGGEVCVAAFIAGSPIVTVPNVVIDLEAVADVTVAVFPEDVNGDCTVAEGQLADLAAALDFGVVDDEGNVDLLLDLDADVEVCVAVINENGVIIDLDEDVVLDVELGGVIELINVIDLDDLLIDFGIDIR